MLVLTDVFTKSLDPLLPKDHKAITPARVLVKEWFVRFSVPKAGFLLHRMGRSVKNTHVQFRIRPFILYDYSLEQNYSKRKEEKYRINKRKPKTFQNG